MFHWSHWWSLTTISYATHLGKLLKRAWWLLPLEPTGGSNQKQVTSLQPHPLIALTHQASHHPLVSQTIFWTPSVSTVPWERWIIEEISSWPLNVCISTHDHTKLWVRFHPNPGNGHKCTRATCFGRNEMYIVYPSTKMSPLYVVQDKTHDADLFKLLH